MKLGYRLDLDYEAKKARIWYDSTIVEGFLWPEVIKFEFGVNEEKECFEKLKELELDPESQEADLLYWFFKDLRDIEREEASKIN